ncbi:iron-sulfur cluster repair di-iron protein [Rhodobacter ferrooxidans]|uniref:Hemerythrin-like domain-containing protein n=1 Tax=Rhodobacter ferrooxidans TaxID=371731 RepID=C8RWH3_9RHOB|nr:iron-sulfur cluster repair di-iron protein [Rhodobacter sp. SW2]EEW26916.1 protein of unknown function DUF542 ScdA domain protein [Rhodobacter sp. SW2]
MVVFSPETSVGEFAADLPGAAEIFRKADISFCCGGSLSLADAATRAGLDPAALLAELHALADVAATEAPTDTPALIDHILSRYHQTHRAELEWLIPLAEKVEAVHGDHQAAPLGVMAALIALERELDSHMMKEEQVLFPMMQAGGHPMIAHPIAAMRHEHDTTNDLLRDVLRVTHNLDLPDGACRSWTALYTGLRKFADDLTRHIALENQVLFPRFAAQAT